MTTRDHLKFLTARCDYIAPDGSEIRLLVEGTNGSLAHCILPAGHISTAVRHKTVEELWFVLEGRGQLWSDTDNETVTIRAGASLRIPAGVAFQFRADAAKNLIVLITTIPPWPGPLEAEIVENGMWTPTVRPRR